MQTYIHYEDKPTKNEHQYIIQTSVLKSIRIVTQCGLGIPAVATEEV